MSLAKPVVLFLVVFGARAIQLQGPPAGMNSTCTAQLALFKASDKEAAAKC
eukprot:CAMPEP_0172684906 /NCGR_PEP_ID=MMETSP1074-20121228/19892_1 /TAXON_ID=2916 /ORGANISM="Ceratium fusus, Strain PA161109" /LENGTH=50 /DNA_ID=CAMNT_0013503987 /DNA_START=102 /DNA_END=251 /DNA_ORIENTATION=+